MVLPARRQIVASASIERLASLSSASKPPCASETRQHSRSHDFLEAELLDAEERVPRLHSVVEDGPLLGPAEFPQQMA